MIPPGVFRRVHVANLLLLLLCAGCQSKKSGEGLEADLRLLQARTMPPGARMMVQSGPQRRGWRTEALWEFETDWNWNTYVEWTRGQLQPEFRTQFDGKSVLFRRYAHGDSTQLMVSHVEEDNRLKVTVKYVSHPD